MKSSDKNKEEWIDTTMNSFEGIQRAEAPDFLFHKLEKRLTDKIFPLRTGIVPFRVVSVVAALIILLVSVNLFILTRQSKMNPNHSGIEKIATYYGLNNNNILDNL